MMMSPPQEQTKLRAAPINQAPAKSTQERIPHRTPQMHHFTFAEVARLATQYSSNAPLHLHRSGTAGHTILLECTTSPSQKWHGWPHSTPRMHHFTFAEAARLHPHSIQWTTALHTNKQVWADSIRHDDDDDDITQERMKFRDRYPTTGTGPLYTSSANLRTAASRVPYIYSSHICSPGK